MPINKYDLFPIKSGIKSFIRTYADRVRALRKYGNHKRNCSKNIDINFGCDCGWDEIEKQIESNNDIINQEIEYGCKKS